LVASRARLSPAWATSRSPAASLLLAVLAVREAWDEAWGENENRRPNRLLLGDRLARGPKLCPEMRGSEDTATVVGLYRAWMSEGGQIHNAARARALENK